MKKTLLFLLAVTLIILSFDCFSQSQKKIAGKLVDSNGDGVPGVTITLKGTTKQATTDIDGNFSINASDSAVLVISFMGYSTEEVEVGLNSTIDLMITETGIKIIYWCCTSHKRKPHCAIQKSELEETHSSDEKYVRKNQNL